MLKRESIEWCQFYWFDTDSVHLPRILLIGDSVVAAHRQALAERLKRCATIAAFSTSKIVGDPALPRELALALAGIPVIDLYSAMLGHPEYRSTDGFHHNWDGVVAQAELLEREITPFLAGLTPTVSVNLQT